jgi:PAS domain S-box-containing protein
MKARGLTAKVLFPIVAVMLILAAFGALRTRGIIHDVMDDYHRMIIAQERDEILNILRTGLPEVALLAELRNHFSTESFRYKVTREGRPLVVCCNFPGSYRVSHDGFLSGREGDNLYFGYRIDAERYGLVIDILRGFPREAEFTRQLNSTVTVFLVSILLMIVYIMAIVRKNLIGPIRNIMFRVKTAGPAPHTGIRELDDLGDALNDSFATAEAMHMQAKTLHKVAVVLNEKKTLEEIMDTIVGQSRVLIDADLSAISLYDEKGDFSKLKVYGVDEGDVFDKVKKMPRGEGILQMLKYSMAPVRIDDLTSHPAFSGSFPEGHPEIRNFLGSPIFSNEGRPLAALYFANKRSGSFTVEDENMVAAIASDTAVAIQRVRDTDELARFKKIIESSFDVIVITDAKGDITYVNPAFESVTGYSAAEVLGKNPKILKSGVHSDRVYAGLWSDILSGRPWKGEFVNRKKNGQFYHTSAVIFPIFSDPGQIGNFVSIQRDVSEEKKLYEQLLRAQKMEAIGTLAGGIAHDFNNLLAAVIGYAELMKDDMPESSPHYKQISIIENSAKRGADLAARILNVTKKEKLEYKVGNLNKVVEGTLALLARSFPKDISIETKLDPGLPNIRADVTQLQQVVMNLAVNARDAMPDGGMLVFETAAVGNENGAAGAADFPAGFVKLSVSDSGKGMDKEIAQKVFDPFFTTKSRGTGTGLGLYIVHSIVANHGGYINLYTEPGRGSRFSAYFPVSLEGAGVTEENALVGGEAQEGKGNILVIDDEPDVRELTKDVLERLGYTVITTPGGREGIMMFREKKDDIDVVVLDMIMPLMNGAEVFQVLKGIQPGVRVVLVSGFSTEGFSGINRLLKAGAKAFVQKPFTQGMLAKAVKEALKG